MVMVQIQMLPIHSKKYTVHVLLETDGEGVVLFVCFTELPHDVVYVPLYFTYSTTYCPSTVPEVMEMVVFPPSASFCLLPLE